MSSTKRCYTTENIESIRTILHVLDSQEESFNEIFLLNSGISLISDLIEAHNPEKDLEDFSSSQRWRLRRIDQGLSKIQAEVENVDTGEAEFLNKNLEFIQQSLMAGLDEYIKVFEQAHLNQDMSGLITSLNQLNEKVQKQKDSLTNLLNPVYVNNAVNSRNKAIRDLGKDIIATPANVTGLVIDLVTGNPLGVVGSFVDSENSLLDLAYSIGGIYYGNQAIDEARTGNYEMANVDAGLTDMFNDIHGTADQFFTQAKWAAWELKELEDKYKLLNVLSDEDFEKYYQERSKLEDQLVLNMIEAIVASGVDFVTSLISVYGSLKDLGPKDLSKKASEIIEKLKDGKTVMSTLKSSYNTIFNSDNPADIISNLIDAILSGFGITDDSKPASKIAGVISGGKSVVDFFLSASPEQINLIQSSLIAQNALEQLPQNSEMLDTVEVKPMNTDALISAVSEWDSAWTFPRTGINSNVFHSWQDLLDSGEFSEIASEIEL